MFLVCRMVPALQARHSAPIYTHSCVAFASELSSARTHLLVSHPPSFCLLIPSTSFWSWCCDAWTWPSLTLFLSHCVSPTKACFISPVLLWQRMRWRGIRGTFPNTGILQGVHSGNIYRSVPTSIYATCIYPNVNIQIYLLSLQFGNLLRVSSLRICGETSLSVVRMAAGFLGEEQTFS